ncbi:Putative O-antigen transporter [Clostridiales bacterium CHKCI006]|nr:Putative O-antigen transporter [Clostridiales bacterium CHKCI006]
MKNIKKILYNKSFQNGGWMYLLQFFNTILPLVTLPYITRILGTTQYGTFSIALNIIGYLQVIIEYGFGMSATRKIALSNKNTTQISKIFTCVIFSRTILLIGTYLFVVAYCLINSNGYVQIVSLLVLSICLFGYCLEQSWLFQGMQELKYLSIINIIARSVSVILIFVLIKTSNDLIMYCFLYSISPLLSGILGVILAHKKYQVKLIKVNVDDIIEELKNGWYVFTTQLSSKVFGSIGITFLGIFSSSSIVGIFSAIQKIPNLLMLAWSPISQILYPISSKKIQNSYSEGKRFILKVKNILVLIFSFVAIFIAIFSKPIIHIAFGSQYSVYYYWIFPLLLWLIIAILNNFYGIQILLGSGYDREYSKCFQIGVVCTLLFNFTFIFFWGGLGAAIAPLASELILTVLLKKEIKKIEKLN